MSDTDPEPPPSLTRETADAASKIRNLLAVALNASPGPGTWSPPDVSALQGAIPGFTVLEQTGRGATGAVYRAVRAPGQHGEEDEPVAIKVLPVQAERDLEFEARFLRETKAMTRLQHPNLVRIQDSGQTQNRDGYLVMEYVAGGDLRQRLENGPIEMPAALEVARQICAGLQYAHAQGYVHRDIKPANILLTLDGGAKLGDFGLAKLIDPATASETEQFGLTQTGMAPGTPSYMAPEQVAGLSVDHRADLYSLGVTLYEMLTGSVPRGAFAPPSTKVGIDRRLDAVVMKAMSEAPERRYASAQELAEDLRLIATGARGRTLAEREQPPARTAAWWTWIILLASVAIFATGGGILWRSAQPPAEPTVPPSLASQEQPFQNHLGMRFVPVPVIGGPTNGKRILFSVWETRVRDYQAFAEATQREWPNAGGPHDDEHPATMVTWEDAVAFCEWLSAEERRAGRIGTQDTYRLPSDHEWSCAAGIGAEEDPEATPISKSGKLPIYPWGPEYPPPTGAGNYLGQESVLGIKSPDRPIPGYRDGFADTAPVGRFPANSLGLFDLGGNVWEVCADWRDPAAPSAKVLRGACWNVANGMTLKLSMRGSLAPVHRSETTVGRFGTVGFRVVLEVE